MTRPNKKPSSFSREELDAGLAHLLSCVGSKAKPPAGFYSVRDIVNREGGSYVTWQRRLDKAVDAGKLSKILLQDGSHRRSYYGPKK
jgi:hypothetical protein